MNPVRWLGAASFVSVLSIAPAALADLAPPGPEFLECPSGAMGALPTVPAGAMDPRGRPVRPWPYCAPTTCTADTDCTGGRTCSAEEIGLCVEDHTVEGGGATVRAARDRGCEPDGTCLNINATCERARRCVLPEGALPPSPVELPAAPEAPVAPELPPPPPPAPAPAAAPTASAGCGCAASTTAGPSWLAALVPLAIWLRRRR